MPSGAYIKAALGNDWGTAELDKEQAERHPVLI
jgi:hypothetical protein